MKVTVTGAGGNLGGVVVRRLVELGYDVVATDVSARLDLPVKLRVGNLLQRESVYPLIEGADAVVHLGNHPYMHGPDPQKIFNENVTMNMNVAEATRQLGVKKLIFASSIQAIGGKRTAGEPDMGSRLPYLPLDGDVPANPGNPYALSKAATEVMLQYFGRYGGMSCTALRFPFLVHPSRVAGYLAEKRTEPPQGSNMDEACTYLLMSDAADLVDAILKAPLEGFRIYFPVHTKPSLAISIPEIIRKYFPKVPLKKPIDQITSLVDISRITQETGWAPKPH